MSLRPPQPRAKRLAVSEPVSHPTKRGKAAKTYPIRTVARLTGLTPDLIRAWERRYAVVQPLRGPRGARLYGPDDVARLEVLARVVDSGRSIGDIAHLGDTDLEDLLPSADAVVGVDATVGPLPAVDELLAAVEQLDMVRFEGGLGRALLALGATAFANEIALPLIREVGARWSAGQLSIGQEHLVTSSLRSLLGSLVRARRDPESATIVLTTVNGERHELGLLLVAVLAAEQGIRVHLLGTDLPAQEIVATARRLDADVVGLSFIAAENRQTATRALEQIQQGLPEHVRIWAGGADAAAVVAQLADERTAVIQEIALLQHHLGQLRRAR